MWSSYTSFFWDEKIYAPLLVKDGFDHDLGYDRDGNPIHTRWNVFRAMHLQICMHYRSLPDPRTLDLDEIEYYYEGIRAQLKEDTKQNA